MVSITGHIPLILFKKFENKIQKEKEKGSPELTKCKKIGELVENYVYGG